MIEIQRSYAKRQAMETGKIFLLVEYGRNMIRPISLDRFIQDKGYKNAEILEIFFSR